jgi:UDP-N-acetylmuramate dehydrogenase
MNLFAGLEEIVTENEPLGPFTWIRIGGPARYLVRPRSEAELQETVRRCAENGQRWRVMGQGANLLIDDKGLNCVVIKLGEGHFNSIGIEGTKVALGGAVAVGHAIQNTIKAGLSGMEVLVGIPGSVGGAIRMNAGGRFGDIGTVVSRVEVVDSTGTTTWREKPELTFEYRKANITDQVVTKVELELVPDDPQRILNRMRETWILKKSAQPLSAKSAGCVFKNPSGQGSAGQMIDKLGFKGKALGGAMVSDLHANFIVNQGEAKFEDVMGLIDQIKQAVMERYGVEMELEVEVWRDQN